ncbi:hypothetical protein TNCV_4073451 [Trichonephila clavipes]|uniref:Uncharacterized protein n=1 Tax=Trichonephila clavipes TaxID=2585209 RepID=A0A8X7BH01_TRICX|nr:hypothetical protein TNCV_4073451 [Trichonephila clavipes]
MWFNADVPWSIAGAVDHVQSAQGRDLWTGGFLWRYRTRYLLIRQNFIEAELRTKRDLFLPLRLRPRAWSQLAHALKLSEL